MMNDPMKPLPRPAVKVGAAGALLSGLLMVGEVHAAECRLSLSRPEVDLDALRHGGQVAAQGVLFGKRTVHLNVVCPQDTVIAVRFRGVPAVGQGFRFGHQGYFTLSLQQPVLDGRPVELAPLHHRAERNSQLLPDQAMVVLAAGLPAVGRVFSAQVQVDTYLFNTATAVRDKTVLEGSGRFELVPAG